MAAVGASGTSESSRASPVLAAAASRDVADCDAKVCLWYQYVHIEDPDAEAEAHKAVCVRLGLLGRVRVAGEGVNATVAGSPRAIAAYTDHWRADPRFAASDFKVSSVKPLKSVVATAAMHTSCAGPDSPDDSRGRGAVARAGDGSASPESRTGGWTLSGSLARSGAPADAAASADAHARNPFSALAVKVVAELVSSGGAFAAADLSCGGGRYLSPREFHAMLGAPADAEAATATRAAAAATGGAAATADAPLPRDVVVVDVRNCYETQVGHFAGSTDPHTRSFADMPRWLEEHYEELSKSTVLMMCTGGIRCERASAYLRHLGHTDVCQLRGGVHRYLETYPDGGHWRGKLFVFDSRVTVPPPALAATPGAATIASCLYCRARFDGLSGDRRCAQCRVLVVVCPDCVARRGAARVHCSSHKWIGDSAAEELAERRRCAKAELAALRASEPSDARAAAIRRAQKSLSLIDRVIEDVRGRTAVEPSRQ